MTNYDESEYYDMDKLETKLANRLEQIEHKLDILLEETEDNNSRIRNIQFNFTRALVFRLLKWAIVIGIMYWAYSNFVSPIISVVSQRYHQATNVLEKIDSTNTNTQSFGNSIKEIFTNADEVLDLVRPNKN